MKQLKVLNLPQIEAQLCCSCIADVVNVNEHPQVIPGYYLVRSCESQSPKELTAQQYQDYQNHILFGNTAPIPKLTNCVIGVVYVSEILNVSDSIWYDDAFPFHLRVEKSFRFVNPCLLDNHQDFDSTKLTGLVMEAKLNPYTENDTLFVPLCEDVFIYIQEGESVFINITPSIAQLVTHFDGTLRIFNRVTFFCGKYNRSFQLIENNMAFEFQSSIDKFEAKKDDSKFLELKITLGKEISPI